MSKDLLREIRVDLEVLKHRVEVQERFIHILMAMIPKSRQSGLATLFKAYKLNVTALEENGEFLAKGMQVFKDYTDSLGDDPKVAASALLTQALLLLNAPEGQQEAMRTWLSIATEDELVHELLQSLNLSQKNTPPSGADSDGHARDDKE
ncbi:hypothetical protein [Serratia marcescens]|uniref:hypothetical protein n=1 Tax=Serratia marcescens TaxID=615 RepID=UPI0025AAD19E|nr:hypothetical protein [Serratia marcescens]MDN0028172.1 hypothetical protein [Serratia marcescens]